jgi:tetratricopeptide (TPR) repeat protein
MPPNIDRIARAYELLRLERYDLALAEAGQALAADPQSAEAHICAAWALRDLGRLAEATDAARAALAAGPQLAAAHNVLACVQWRAGRRSAAEDAFKSMMACPTPPPPEFVTNYARFLVASNRPAIALAIVGQALAVAPTLASGHEVRGHALADLGLRGDAAAAYRATLGLDPRNFSAHNRLGQIQLAEGQPLAALESFREALRLRPGEPSARANLVSALKARHPFYGRVLRVVLRLRSRRLTSALLGLAVIVFFVPAILAALAGEGSALDTAMFNLWTWGIYGIVGAVLANLAWHGIIDPIFNSLLLFDPLGRQAIDYKPADVVRAGTLALLLVSVIGLLSSVLLLGGDHPVADVFAGLLVACLLALILPLDFPDAARPWRQLIWGGYGGTVVGTWGLLTSVNLDAEALLEASGLLLTGGLLVYGLGWALGPARTLRRRPAPRWDAWWGGPLRFQIRSLPLLIRLVLAGIVILVGCLLLIALLTEPGPLP